MNVALKQLAQWPPTSSTVIGGGVLVGLVIYMLTGSLELALLLAGLFKVLVPEDAAATDQAVAALNTAVAQIPIKKTPPTIVGALLAVALVPLLGGCTSQIGANPLSGALGAQFTTDLVSASYNLDQAVSVGALEVNDPAPPCLHAALIDLGVGVTTPSFTPKNDGLVSAGAILYIRARQAEKLAGGVTLPKDCKAIIGQVVLDAAGATKNLMPGGGLLPTIR